MIEMKGILHYFATAVRIVTAACTTFWIVLADLRHVDAPWSALDLQDGMLWYWGYLYAYVLLPFIGWEYLWPLIDVHRTVGIELYCGVGLITLALLSTSRGSLICFMIAAVHVVAYLGLSFFAPSELNEYALRHDFLKPLSSWVLPLWTLMSLLLFCVYLAKWRLWVKMTKRRHVLAVLTVGLLLLAVAVFFGWNAIFTRHSVVQATSPDYSYTATVSSTFGLSTNHFDIKVVNWNGQLVRHLAVGDKLPGWSADPSITWARDSKTVTVGLQDPDAGVSPQRIVVDVP